MAVVKRSEEMDAPAKASRVAAEHWVASRSAATRLDDFYDVVNRGLAVLDHGYSGFGRYAATFF